MEARALRQRPDLPGLKDPRIQTMRERSDSRWVLHGREEDMTIHDEGGMRHFYAEWSRRMGRLASDPYAGAAPTSAAGA